jgi:hypothetical protein
VAITRKLLNIWQLSSNIKNMVTADFIINDLPAKLRLYRLLAKSCINFIYDPDQFLNCRQTLAAALLPAP